MGSIGLDCVSSFGGIVGFEKGIDDWAPIDTVGVGDILLCVVFEAVTAFIVDIGGSESECGCKSVRIVRSES